MFCHSLAACNPSTFSELVSSCSKIYMSSSLTKSGPSFPKVFHYWPRFAYLHTQLLGYFGLWIQKETKQNTKTSSNMPQFTETIVCISVGKQLLQLVLCFFLSLNDRTQAPVCLCVYRHLPGERNWNPSHSSKDSKCTLSTDWPTGCWSSMQVPLDSRVQLTLLPLSSPDKYSTSAPMKSRRMPRPGLVDGPRMLSEELGGMDSNPQRFDHWTLALVSSSLR